MPSTPQGDGSCPGASPGRRRESEAHRQPRAPPPARLTRRGVCGERALNCKGRSRLEDEHHQHLEIGLRSGYRAAPSKLRLSIRGFSKFRENSPMKGTMRPRPVVRTAFHPLLVVLCGLLWPGQGNVRAPNCRLLVLGHRLKSSPSSRKGRALGRSENTLSNKKTGVDTTRSK